MLRELFNAGKIAPLDAFGAHFAYSLTNGYDDRGKVNLSFSDFANYYSHLSMASHIYTIGSNFNTFSLENYLNGLRSKGLTTRKKVGKNNTFFSFGGIVNGLYLDDPIKFALNCLWYQVRHRGGMEGLIDSNVKMDLPVFRLIDYFISKLNYDLVINFRSDDNKEISEELRKIHLESEINKAMKEIKFGNKMIQLFNDLSNKYYFDEKTVKYCDKDIAENYLTFGILYSDCDKEAFLNNYVSFFRTSSRQENNFERLVDIANAISKQKYSINNIYKGYLDLQSKRAQNLKKKINS